MEYFRLTTPQQNIWNLQKYYEDTAIANLCGAIIFKEKRNHTWLRQSVLLFVQNQKGLRLRFCEKDGTKQYVADVSELEIPAMTFPSMKELDLYAEAFTQDPIGLIDRPMYRFAVFDVGDRSGILVLLSHLVSDAWTFGLMANQLDQAYRKLAGEDGISLVCGDYTDYIHAEDAYLVSSRYEKDKTYWEERYGIRPEESPVKLSTAMNKSIKAKRITRELPFVLEQKIDSHCRQNPVTPAVLFETALAAYLAKINPDNQTITIGVPVLNRSNASEKKIAGMFVSIMPLTISVPDGITVEELERQITRGHMDLFRHQKYPYADILKSLREKQNFSGNLYEVMISYQNAKTDTGADTKWYSNGACEVPLTIHIDNRDGKNSHTINVDYQTGIFRDETEVEAVIRRLEYLIGQMTEDPAVPVGRLRIVPDAERETVLYKWNDTYEENTDRFCIHELFSRQAERTPDHTALVFQDKKITYRQLDQMSDILAHKLREKGTGRNDVVPIITIRSWHVIVAMLGVLKAGGAYMLVDPGYPEERIQSMLEIAECKFALCFGYSGPLSVECLDLAKIDFGKHVPSVRNISQPEDSAYIIFTSGSTGTPKGTVVSHGNVCNYAQDNGSNRVFHHIIDRKYQGIVSVTNIIFDIFVTESIFPLLHGLCIYFADDQEAVSQRKLGRLLTEHPVDVIQTTPTKMRSYMLDKTQVEYLRRLKLIILGGEALPLDLYHELRGCTNAHICNIYGPAETTVWSTNTEVLDADITIGSPVANTQIYILDQAGAPVPIGVAGELCIAGAGVGKGYLNRPELTAERFVPNPFATEENHHGRIMYHTGDLARWRSDGKLEYLGRMDTQVKIRGLRIELGEIESVMGSMEGLGLVAVADRRDENGRQYLVGYYTAAESLDEKKLRQHLSARLPKYMVPNYFVHLKEMPMTASGKVDRRNLPVPCFKPMTIAYEAPASYTEKMLAEIWCQLLQVETVGRYDDFFEFGGDSLLAISMLNEIEDKFHVEVSVKDIMESSILEQMAQHIEHAQVINHIILYNENKYVLMPQQKAIYAACCKEPDTLAYNMPAKIHFSDQINVERLKQSIHQVLEHHKILKSYIQVEENEIYGIYNKDLSITFEQYGNNSYGEFVRSFDLKKGPLVRIGFTEDALLFDIHHIIADGESLDIILRDIIRVYEGKKLPENKAEYSDYVKYFYDLNTTEHKEYFKNRLKCDFESVMLPESKTEKQGGKSKFFQIPDRVFEETKRYAKKNGLTDTMVYLGVYGILLYKYTGKTDFLSSIILQNRIHVDTRNMVGMFANTLPIRFLIKESVVEYMWEIKNSLLDLYHYQELPFWEIADAVGMPDKSFLNTSFVYQASGEKTLTLEGQKIVPQYLDTKTAKFDLSMEVTPFEKGCHIRIEYDCSKYEETLISDLVDSYILILMQISKKNIADISLLLGEKYDRIINGFNNTFMKCNNSKCVHEIFSEHAFDAPEKIALTFEDCKFTYRQLDEMSNSLAHFLRKKESRLKGIVPIVARRSWHIIVAMLGVLKAGKAYLLIDCQYPQERIEYLIEECNAETVMTCGCQYKKGVDVNSVSDYSSRESIYSINEQEDIFCAIHTSGSTGVPKLTALTHANIVHYINYSRELFRGTEQTISTTNITFDAFIQETIVALCNGIPVVLLNDNQSSSQSAFEEIVLQYTNSFLFQTPTKLFSYIRNSASGAFLKNIHSFVLGGEVFSEQLYNLIREQNSMCRIYNIYGPTETTICVSVENVNKQKGITIGSPVANTQIYILDQAGAPVPIGVAGELCIAGAGVGKGYLNRPELTAERFVPNPFATEENHHGRIMYHTGDLARWRSDGKLEYLGRMDTQVKIRGLRIELGEIESVMGSMEGLGLVAVADRRDENGRQYLVGYYTAAESLDEKKLRQHLSARLPKYMVPNYFVHLKEMPMTASGKVDRRNLPVPEFTVGVAEYTAPETERERSLCQLLEEILHMEPVGMIHDFFECGGDSLAAIEYVAKAHSRGISFALQNVFDYPTVQGLCEFLDQETVEKYSVEGEDFEKYQHLFTNNIVDETITFTKKSLGNIMLTGATGFLGAHVLDCLMQEEWGNIYCLVRGKDGESYRDRLEHVLNYYFGNKYETEYGNRIIAVEGTIERPDLGDMVPADVQTVIHTAASVKHYGSYGYFNHVNVEGTKHVLEYARSTGAKLIHISTLSVSGNSLADNFAVYRSGEEKHFDERSFYIGQPLDNVYIRSKFEAEKIVFDAILQGMDAKVIRIGNLTNRISDYKFQPNYSQNAFLTRVKAVLEFGWFPDYLMPLYAEFSPVDLTAGGIIKIAQYAESQNLFHLNSNRPVYFRRFLEILQELNIFLKVTDGETFHKKLLETMKQNGTEYIFEALQNDMDDQGRLVYDSNIRIQNDFTAWFLKHTGFTWNETSLEYIKGYVNYFREIGYLKV